MVDVGGQNGPPARNFRPHEFRRDLIGNLGPEIFAIPRRRLFGTAQIFTDGHIFHFRSNDPRPRIGQLRHILARLGPQRTAALAVEHRHGNGFPRLQPVIFGLVGTARIGFHIPPVQNPLGAQGRQPLGNVDHRILIGIRSRRIVQRHRRLARTGFQHHLAHGHVHPRQRAFDFDLAGTGQRPGGDGKGRTAIGHGKRLQKTMRGFKGSGKAIRSLRRVQPEQVPRVAAPLMNRLSAPSWRGLPFGLWWTMWRPRPPKVKTQTTGMQNHDWQ